MTPRLRWPYAPPSRSLGTDCKYFVLNVGLPWIISECREFKVVVGIVDCMIMSIHGGRGAQPAFKVGCKGLSRRYCISVCSLISNLCFEVQKSTYFVH